jgi:membrane protease YdiL (CAAX protease family)
VKVAVLGLAVAAALFPWALRTRRGDVWARMPLAAGGLGMLALRARPDLRSETPSFIDVVTGVSSALALHQVFQVGDRLARRYMPRGAGDLDAIDELRHGAPRWLIAALLAGLIAPCEELFWRGLVQDALAKRYGRFQGAALASLAYGGVHLGSGNLTLTGAAGIAGGFWGLQYALQRRIPAVIVSHIVLDFWLFLLPPGSGDRSKSESGP